MYGQDVILAIGKVKKFQVFFMKPCISYEVVELTKKEYHMGLLSFEFHRWYYLHYISSHMIFFTIKMLKNLSMRYFYNFIFFLAQQQHFISPILNTKLMTTQDFYHIYNEVV